MNVNLIRKLSDKELLAYMDEKNMYTSEAVALAVIILEKERNYKFTEEEYKKIAEVIKYKDDLKLDRAQVYEYGDEVGDVQENSHLPKINSETYVISVCIFSVLVSGFLIYDNLKILEIDSKKNKRELIILVTIFSIIITSALVFYDVYGYDYMLEYEERDHSYSRYRITANNSYFFIYVILNFLFSFIIWNVFMKSGMKYRAKMQPNHKI